MSSFEKCSVCGEPVFPGAMEAHRANCRGVTAADPYPSTLQNASPLPASGLSLDPPAAREKRGWLLGWVLSFLMPWYGLPLGLYLYTSDDPEKRSAGVSYIQAAILPGLLLLYWFASTLDGIRQSTP